MAGQLFLIGGSSKSLPARIVSPHLSNSIKKYSGCQRSKEDDGGGHVISNKAPSLADEFRRVAKEKAKAKEKTRVAEEQGIAGQTSDKMCDGVDEATVGDVDPENVKKRLEEHEPVADHRRKG